MNGGWMLISEIEPQDRNRYLIGQDRDGTVREMKWWDNNGADAWEYHGGNRFDPIYFQRMPEEYRP